MAIRYSSVLGNEDSKQSIEESILNLIEKGMTEGLFVTDHIEKVAFIPELITDHIDSNEGETETPPNSETIGDNQILIPTSSSSNIGLSASVITIAAVIVVGTVLFIKRKIKKSRQALEKDNISPISGDEDFRFEEEDNFNETDDDEWDDAQAVYNPAKEKYNNQCIERNTLFLDTISEVSEETDSSSLVNPEAAPSRSRLQIIQEKYTI